MLDLNEEVRITVGQRDEEFRRWSDEHHSYEHRLDELAHKRAMTPEEEVEEKRLKKRKLALKDMMFGKLREFAQQRRS